MSKRPALLYCYYCLGGGPHPVMLPHRMLQWKWGLLYKWQMLYPLYISLTQENCSTSFFFFFGSALVLERLKNRGFSDVNAGLDIDICIAVASVQCPSCKEFY